MNRILYFSLLLSIFVLLLLAACPGAENNVTSGTRDGVLHLGNGTEPQDLDPHTVTGVSEHNIISALLEGLVTEHPETLAPQPGAASSWDISHDGLTYTFHLQPRGRWSNGDPVTAEDFVYGWKRMLTPALGAEYAYHLYDVAGAEAFHKGESRDFGTVGITALDDLTLRVTLRHSVPYFLSLLAHYSTFPVHRPTIEAFGDIGEKGTLWTRAGNFVGNGPFVLKEWALNRIIVVEKNPLYWNARQVSLGQIRFYPIDNVTTEERMFRSGALHVTYTMPIDKIEVYRRNRPDLLRISPYLGTYYYLFNTRRKPFDDPRVRRALAMSFDRRRIVERVTKGGQLPAHAFTPPGIPGYAPRAHIAFDIAQARRLLAEAGYPEGRGFPAVELLYNTSEGHRKIAIALQQMWKEALNIEIRLVNQDWKVYLASRRNLDYDMARAGWIGDYPDPNTFLELMVTHSGNNHTGWSNAAYDRLIDQAARTAEAAERFALFQEAEALLMQEVPVLPIYFYTHAALISPDVKGWHENVLDHHPYPYVRLAPSATGAGRPGDVAAPRPDAE